MTERRASLLRMVLAAFVLVVGAAAGRAQGTPSGDTAGARGARGARRSSAWTRAVGNDTSRLVWRGLDYGSEAAFSPVQVLLNKGFESMQQRSSDRDVWRVPYKAAWNAAVVGVANDSRGAIRRFGGWGKFVRVELFPFKFDRVSMNWLPNYAEHLIGGGLQMRGLEEWYREHRAPVPWLWAMLTTYSASLLNEMVETGASEVGAGTVADLLVFDMGAVALFHWGQPTRFLTRTLQFANWSNQATFTFPNRKLQNNGEYWSMKVPIGLERWRPFVRFGFSGQLGLSWKQDDEHHLSIAFGEDTDARYVDEVGHETITLKRGGGIYFDRDNSLLWSVTGSGTENLAAVNVYPGVLPGPARHIGVWAIYTLSKQITFGIVHRQSFGLGLGYGK